MKKFLTVLLTFTLYFNLITQANAASLGGWSLGSPVASGASAIVNGTKEIILNGASKIAKGTAKITPNATQVAKVLARGAAGYALSVAVEQLLGSVDWVLDPANNQIIWSETTEVPVGTAYWITQINESKSTVSALDSCTKYMNHNAKYISYGSGISYKNPSTYYYHTYSGGKYFYCEYDVLKAGVLQSTEKVAGQLVGQSTVEEKDKKTMPLDVVAQKVISNAEGGDSNAQAATTAAAQDIINDAEKDSAKAAPIINQLEASKSIEAENTATGEQTQNPDKPNVTNIKLEFPAFCGWAPLVCEAAQTVISFPITLTSWWNTANQKADSWANSISQSWAEAKEWATSEKNEDTELDIPDQEQPDIDTDIAFGGMCPDDRQAEINMGVGVIKMPISYEPICTTVSTAKPVLIFVGFFVAALIIGGVKTE